jgi:glycosyltransferase involved in cell wall biosynthesis
VALPARALFRHAAGIWCVNLEDAAFYETEYRITRDRLAVIPHSIEASFFEPCGAARDWNQLLFVGTWIPRKGSDLLERCLPAVLSRAPDCRVVLAGVLVPEQDVRARLPRGSQHRVEVRTRVDDTELRALYGTSGLLLVPSRLEGLPFSLLEGFAGGCPALASAHSGMRDVVIEGRNGWLVDGDDPNRWTERILALLGDLDGRRAASDGARRSAQGFRTPDLTRAALAWYESLR